MWEWKEGCFLPFADLLVSLQDMDKWTQRQATFPATSEREGGKTRAVNWGLNGNAIAAALESHISHHLSQYGHTLS